MSKQEEEYAFLGWETSEIGKGHRRLARATPLASSLLVNQSMFSSLGDDRNNCYPQWVQPTPHPMHMFQKWKKKKKRCSCLPLSWRGWPREGEPNQVQWWQRGTCAYMLSCSLSTVTAPTSSHTHCMTCKPGWPDANATSAVALGTRHCSALRHLSSVRLQSCPCAVCCQNTFFEHGSAKAGKEL